MCEEHGVHFYFIAFFLRFCVFFGFEELDDVGISIDAGVDEGNGFGQLGFCDSTGNIFLEMSDF
jgi:hypothetical protein